MCESSFGRHYGAFEDVRRFESCIAPVRLR